MKRLFAWQALAAFMLILGIVAYGTRVAQVLMPGAIVDAGARHPSTLSPALRAWIEQLRTPLTVTLFLTTDDSLPTHLKSIGPATRQLLEAMEAAGQGRVRTRVIDPDLSVPAGAAYAARGRVSPVRVRQVIDDRDSEATIWASLVLSRPGSPDVLIQGIGPQHLPHLQSWVLAHLRQATPRAPRFAIDVPPGYTQLGGHLAQHGPVIDVDFDRGALLPPDADLFVWIQPERVTAAHIARLQAFLASGRSVVLAGSPHRLIYDDEHHFHGTSTGPAWADLLRPFGLQPTPDLLLDRNSGPAIVSLPDGPRPIQAPFHLRNLPAFRDFRPLPVQARGGLAFAGAGALQIDPSRVQAAGWQAHVAATTTQFAWVHDVPETATTIESLGEGLPVPKQNLMVLLSSADPRSSSWSGQVLVLAAPTPFADASLSQPGYGHAIFVRDLVRSLANADQLVRIDVDRHLAPALPPITTVERLFWRLLLIGLLPAAWLLVALRRLQLFRQIRVRPRSLRAILAPAGLICIACLLAGHIDGPRLDLTADRVHTLTGTTLDALQSLPDLRSELVVSPASQLPPHMKRVVAQVQAALSRSSIEWETHRLGASVSAATRQQWTASGIRPFDVERVAHDTSRVGRVIAGLSLRSGDRQTAIPRLDARTLPHLDFLLTAAVERLKTGRSPRLTVVSDLPRLSPAEALEDYQKKGLSAPRGVDVYHQAKQLLQDYGYQIQHVSLRESQFPDDSDAILWFQPRRDATPITEALSRHLASGRPAIVALQHFNIQQRQYRGAGFATVHWPQPQFQDLSRYLELIGVSQPREVLMDRSQHALQLATQVNRSAVREYDAQQVALPFLLRTVTHQHQVDDELSRRLGDLLFIWGNRFDLTQIGSASLQADTLVTTSERAWAFDWRGGWLPPEAFEPVEFLPGQQPLVLRLRGRFPAIQAVRDSAGHRHFTPGPPSQADTQLLLIGSSEMFKDPYLLKAPFAHDQLLLNAVADAMYGDDMLTLQARAGGGRRGFVPPFETERIAWRLAVIGWGPGVLGLFGLWRWRRRMRRS
ncbi:MAG: hypothetical protein HOH74_32515 [Gemmatimonadetes bacterium]|jgi:ABC-type uncharacterized transport system involved in gliding motility auxiliary subunit|nr:hypothetical protein [Gemmatimonadota bacterium]MBT6150211.1 hypothetical protein [Gemmatimonadota bacterium]